MDETTPSKIPPALAGTGNGTLTAVMRVLPQVIAQAVTQAVQQAAHMCAHCVAGRLTWQAEHDQEVRAAVAAAAQAAGVTPETPGVDPVPFLPAELRPGGPRGVPDVHPAVTTLNGTEVCVGHMQALTPAVARKPLLIATGSLSAAQFRMQ